MTDDDVQINKERNLDKNTISIESINFGSFGPGSVAITYRVCLLRGGPKSDVDEFSVEQNLAPYLVSEGLPRAIEECCTDLARKLNHLAQCLGDAKSLAPHFYRDNS